MGEELKFRRIDPDALRAKDHGLSIRNDRIPEERTKRTQRHAKAVSGRRQFVPRPEEIEKMLSRKRLIRVEGQIGE